MAHRVLLTTSVSWPSAARLADGFATAGFAVDVLCPRDAPVRSSRYAAKLFAYRPLAPLSALRAAIAGSRPDVIVPCDDRSVTHLLQLHASARAQEGDWSFIASLIRHSLGNPDAYADMMSRDAFIRIAQQIGVRVPKTFAVASEEELEACLDVIGLPAMVKADGSWGGDGVALVHSRAEARNALRRFANAPSRLRSLARIVRRRDAHHLMAVLAPSAPAVSVQSFIPGHQAASAFACWEGEIVGAIYYDVLVAVGTIGPPSVIRRVDCPQMADASRRVARHFGLSGLHGMDFIRDRTGDVHLLEINPRATQGGTLAFGKGRDLPAALAARIAGGEAPMRPAIPNDRVVFFPREWQRDPASPHFAGAYHDVPWSDPAMARLCLGPQAFDRLWATRYSLPSFSAPLTIPESRQA